ncbi:MAG: hypothetical protein MJZ61_05535 [Bacteroidales bacterium]|nr:hypothetical protein [Bacteroidales bacterium]
MKKLPTFLMTLLMVMMMCNSLWASHVDPEKSGDTKVVDAMDVIDNDPEPDVYWYFIKIKLDSKKRDIEIGAGAPKIKVGSKRQFSKDVWKGIQNRQLCIGPFFSEAEALNSRIYYKKTRDKINELPQATAPSTMYWFDVQLQELKRLNSYEFVSSPMQVNSGSANEFVDNLYEQISVRRVSI